MKIKEKIAEAKENLAIKHEARKKFRSFQKEEELRLIKQLGTTTPGTKEYKAIIADINTLANVHKDDRVSADNIAGALTSLSGLGGAVMYNERHNLPKEAAAFVRRPGKESRVKPDSTPVVKPE